MRPLSKIAAIAFLATSAHAAGNLAGQLNASITLQSGCSVTNASSAGPTGINMGTLSFGSVPATFTGELLAIPAGGVGGAGPTEITCSPDVNSLSVSVSGGGNAGQGAGVGTGSRALKQGSSYLPYELYSDAAMTRVYPASGSAVGISIASTGASFALPIFGRINKTSAIALPGGTYTDVVQVTLSW